MRILKSILGDINESTMKDIKCIVIWDETDVFLRFENIDSPMILSKNYFKRIPYGIWNFSKNIEIIFRLILKILSSTYVTSRKTDKKYKLYFNFLLLCKKKDTKMRHSTTTK